MGIYHSCHYYCSSAWKYTGLKLIIKADHLRMSHPLQKKQSPRHATAA